MTWLHSLKDVPAHLANGLCLAVFPKRVDPRDALVDPQDQLANLPRAPSARPACVGLPSVAHPAEIETAGIVDTCLRKVADNVDVILRPQGLTDNSSDRIEER